jgi:hypothetical protein
MIMADIEKEYENNNKYKVYEIVSTLFAIAFTAGMFVKFLFF